jgi:hypothetical protein
MTTQRAGEAGERPAGKELAFHNFHEALLAYQRKQIGMHTAIRVRTEFNRCMMLPPATKKQWV